MISQFTHHALPGLSFSLIPIPHTNHEDKGTQLKKAGHLLGLFRSRHGVPGFPRKRQSMDSFILRLSVKTDALCGTLTERPVCGRRFLNRETSEIIDEYPPFIESCKRSIVECECCGCTHYQ